VKGGGEPVNEPYLAGAGRLPGRKVGVGSVRNLFPGLPLKM
jgi:hypothetical protein